MQQQRDQNIMDAWKNGGNFEGKPVTDEMVLAHWKERMTHVATDDPLYDTYKNTVTQLEYSVAESKISTLYAQGKVSAGRMAAFYTSWAKKIPVNSEFHRILERNAAQFAKSLRSGGGRGRGRGGGGASITAEAKQQIKYEVPAQYMTNVLTNVAQSMLLIAGDEDLTHFRLGDEENDPGGMVAIINAFNTDPRWATYRAQVMKDLKTLDPSFKGNNFTIANYTQLLRTQSGSLNARALAALQKGQIAKYGTLIKARDKADDLSRQSAAWTPTDTYFRNRDDWLNVWNSSTATPSAKLVASQKYEENLKSLLGQANKRGDMQQATALDSEIRALNGDTNNLKPTLHEDMTALHGTAEENNQNSDAAGTAQGMIDLTAQVQAVTDGRAVYTYGSYSGGKFTPSPGGQAVGTMDVRYITQDPTQYKAMPVAGTAGIESIMVQGAPIMAVQTVPDTTKEPVVGSLGVTTQPTTQLAPTQVGTAYDIYQGGQLVRVYGIPTAGGGQVYTLDPPWAPGVQENFNQVKGSIMLNVPPGATSAYDAFSDPASVQRTGVMPANTYFTPLMAVGMATPEGQNQLAQLSNNPGAVMAYAKLNYGNDLPKQANAFAELLAAGQTAAQAAPGYVPEHMQGLTPGATPPPNVPEHMQGQAPGREVYGPPTTMTPPEDNPFAPLQDVLNPQEVGRKRRKVPDLALPMFRTAPSVDPRWAGFSREVQPIYTPPPLSQHVAVVPPPPPVPYLPPMDQRPDRQNEPPAIPLPPPPPFDYQPHPSGA